MYTKRRLIPLVLAGYAAVAVLIVMPTLRHHRLLGDPASEVYVHIWQHDWIAKAMAGKAHWLSNEMINFPAGGKLFPIDIANSMMYLLLRCCLSLNGAYNALIILQLALAGTAAWMLARDLTGCGWCSLPAGLVYGFNPYVLAYPVSSGVGETLNLAWLPLLLLFVLKAFRTHSWPVAAAAGGMLFMTYFTCPYHGQAALVLLTLLAAGYLLLVRRPDEDLLFRKPSAGIQKKWTIRLARCALVFCGTAGILLSPYYLILTSTLEARNSMLPSDLLEVRKEIDFMAKNFHPSVPSRYTTFIGEYLAIGKDRLVVVNEVTRFYRCNYLGLSVLALAITAMVVERRRLSWLFAGVAAACLLLAAGPFLPLSGRVHLPGPLSPLYLVFVHGLPLFSRMLEPFRLIQPALLLLGVLAGRGCQLVVSGFKREGRRVAAGVLCLLVVIDYLFLSPLPYPLPGCDPCVPPVYDAAAVIPKHKALLELPVGIKGGLLRNRERFYYQLWHGHPILEVIHGHGNWYLGSSGLLRVLNAAEWGFRPGDAGSFRGDIARMTEAGIGGIVIDKSLYRNDYFNTVRVLLDSICGSPVYDDGRYLLYVLGDCAG
ncbi:hypothetical protein JW905_18985 [bacterium]|nr:hypothetical protein [candidate division CSSED10-310 bacterium]